MTGPKMWMEIQRGEGPTAPSLGNELVFIGDVLTIIFTLSDDTYWFDSNVIACFALDGEEVTIGVVGRVIEVVG